MSDFALRRPIRNNFSFKRSFRGRFVGGWRAWYGGGGGGNWIGGQGGGGFRKNRRDKRHKKTVAELDRELDVNFKNFVIKIFIIFGFGKRESEGHFGPL